MKLAELLGELSAYPEDIEVRVLADLGGMLEMKIESGVCQIICVTDYWVGILPSNRMAN